MELSAKIYIAGHLGLVGSAIKKLLEGKNYSNLIYLSKAELDLRDQKQTEKFFSTNKPEYVFNCAAKVGGIIANFTYPAEFLYDNLLISSNIIHFSYKYGVKKLLNLGSSCIYPKFAKQPIKEEYLLTGELESTNEGYAIAKITAIKLCQYYNKQYGTNFISLMPTNLYGTNDNYNLETSHVFPAIIRKILLAKLLQEENFESIEKDLLRVPLGFSIDTNEVVKSKDNIILTLKKLGIEAERVTLGGTGNVRREFLHSDDLADACFHFMSLKEEVKEPLINIGCGKDITIRELAELIKLIAEYGGDVVFDKTIPDGTPQKLLDVSLANRYGWFPKISLKEGIRRTIDEYKQRWHP